MYLMRKEINITIFIIAYPCEKKIRKFEINEIIQSKMKINRIVLRNVALVVFFIIILSTLNSCLYSPYCLINILHNKSIKVNQDSTSQLNLSNELLRLQNRKFAGCSYLSENSLPLVWKLINNFEVSFTYFYSV